MRTNWCLNLFVQQRLLSRYPFYLALCHDTLTTLIIVLIGDPLYAKGVTHWASSSSQLAKCVVEPGTAADVGIIVRNPVLSYHPSRRLTSRELGVVGKTRTPFAVSCLAFLLDAYLK